MFKKFLWVFIETISTVIFQFLSVVILARLLTAHDFGVLGMITIFIAIGNMIVDSGMGSAVVKKEVATEIDFSTLFIYNFLVSIALYLLLFLSSNNIAVFYKTPELSYLIRLLGLVIIISALGVVQNTRLIRELKFKQLAIVAFISNFLSLLIAIILAVNGFGVIALIYQQLTLIVVRVIMLSLLNGFIPKIAFSRSSFKYQFNFGVNILLSNLLFTIYSNISSTIIPKISNITQNGYFVQANKLQSLPISIITAIADKAMFPILAKHQNNGSLMVSARLIIRYTLLAAFPIIAFCSLLARPITLLLLGRKWIYSSVYLEILFLAGFGICLQYLGKNMLKSNGKTKLIFHLEVLKTIIGILTIIVCINYGVIFLMYGIVFSSIFSALLNMVYLKKYMDYSLSDQLLDIKEPITLTIISYVILKVVISYFGIDSAWGLIYFLLGLIIYLIIGLIIKNKEIRSIISCYKIFNLQD